MGVSLSDELASLKIDRGDSVTVRRAKPGGSYRRRGGIGLRLLSWMLWLVPLSMVAGGGFIAYRNFDQVRSRPEVTVGVVQRMTTAEAEKLLTAKGYLKSRYQAMIGTKLPGRVEKMCVEEGMRVKKGDTLAILEHNDLKAMLASREAQTLRTEAELDEARADLWEKERDDNRGQPALRQEDGHFRRARKGPRRPQEGRGARRGARSGRQAHEGQRRRDRRRSSPPCTSSPHLTARSSRNRENRVRSSPPWQ